MDARRQGNSDRTAADRLHGRVDAILPQAAIAWGALRGSQRSLLWIAAGMALWAVAVLGDAPPTALIGTFAVGRGAVLRPRRAIRIAVLGTSACARALACELDVRKIRRYEVVGRVRSQTGGAEPADEWTIGSVGELDRLIEEHRIDLVLRARDVSRIEVFDAMSRGWAAPKAKLWELAAFYEETFGHIPVAEINTAWFQYILHPEYRPTPAPVKRALDVAIGATLALLTLPLLGVLAWLVRRDGGPAFFKQLRVGEAGVPFTIYKLRTMALEAGSEVAWSSRDDARVTRLGRFLRRTHLDELPQLFNVLRGEMSMVGPRPEQPLFVEQLERTIPFYSPRHQIRPGITGWAQVRCGYAGSESGTAWKLCHDLYYLKHRSIWLDLKILARTLVAVAADCQWRELRPVPFVEARAPGEAAIAVPAEIVSPPPSSAPVTVTAMAATPPADAIQTGGNVTGM
jgi:exopolysaccharide biosynthesis polyprenyl glycosylphosphotransferase